MTKKVTLIAAMDMNGLIGKLDENGQEIMPWPKISNDLKHFKKLTMGHPLILGRKTFDSFGRRPLPGRIHIILSRKDVSERDVLLAKNIDDALSFANQHEGDNIFVVGGAEVYTQFLELDLIDEMIITKIFSAFDGDRYFPAYEKAHWNLVSVGEKLQDEVSGLHYQFLHYLKVKQLK